MRKNFFQFVEIENFSALVKVRLFLRWSRWRKLFSGSRIRTYDLKIMSLASYQAALSRTFVFFTVNLYPYPQGNSNPRFLREREMSLASRRWGLFTFSPVERRGPAMSTILSQGEDK